MQWHAIAGTWDGQEPEEGNLGSALPALCRVLSRHTKAGIDCYLALWDGYGWIHGSPAVTVLGSTENVPPAFPPDILNGPRLHHPGRDYLLFVGPLEAAESLGDQVDRDWFERQSPNLLWPADQTWCVATEIDFDSTIVAGTHALISAVLAEPDLESWPIRLDDSLTYDSDTVNR